MPAAAAAATPLRPTLRRRPTWTQVERLRDREQSVPAAPRLRRRPRSTRWPRASRPTACSSRWSSAAHGDRYQLVAGERRLRAAIKAGWADVPVTILEADDRQMAEMAIVENLQRKDLNPLEKAASFQHYLDQYGCTQEELAGRLKHRPLDDRQPDPPAGTARRRAGRDPLRRRSRQGTPGRCCRLGDEARADRVLPADSNRVAFSPGRSKRWCRPRSTRKIIPRPARPRCRPNAPREAAAGKPRHFEQELRTALGTKVDVRSSAAGKGKIVIHFANADEFERLRDHLTDQPVRSQVG